MSFKAGKSKTGAGECAILSWHAVMAALKGDAKPVSTENEQT